jgi:hypothetical protein
MNGQLIARGGSIPVTLGEVTTMNGQIAPSLARTDTFIAVLTKR